MLKRFKQLCKWWIEEYMKQAEMEARMNQMRFI